MGSQKRDVLCDRTSALTNADLQAGEFDFGAAAGSAHEQDGHMVWGVSERPRFNSGAIRNDAIRHKVGGDLGTVPQDYPSDRFCAGVDIYSLRHTSQLAGGRFQTELSWEGGRVGKEWVRTCE